MELLNKNLPTASELELLVVKECSSRCLRLKESLHGDPFFLEALKNRAMKKVASLLPEEKNKILRLLSTIEKKSASGVRVGTAGVYLDILDKDPSIGFFKKIGNKSLNGALSFGAKIEKNDVSGGVSYTLDF